MLKLKLKLKLKLRNYAFSIDQEGFVHYASGEHSGKPVEVLSNPPEKIIPAKKGSIRGLPKELVKEILDKPVTADYDLFSIIPNKNHANNQRPLQVGQNSLRLRRGSVDNIPQDAMRKSAYLQELHRTFKYRNPGTGWNSFSKAEGSKEDLDPNQGISHTFGQALVKDINRNVAEAGYEGGKLVWHGDEMGNPASQGFDPVDAPFFSSRDINPFKLKQNKI